MPPTFKNSTAADFAVAKAPKKRKTTLKPKAKRAEIKNVPFRFLDLPPEIRVIIYKHLLVESSVELSYTTDGQGKGFARGRLNKVPGGGGRYGGGRWVSFKPKRKDNKPTLLHPAILRVCKFIRAEATPYLYIQTFHFENPLALQRFLTRITPSTLLHLRKIVIRGWADRNMSFWREALRLAFAMLTAVRNLESIHFDRRVSDASDFGYGDVGDYYKYLAGHLTTEHIGFWIQYVNAHEGKSAAEILTFSDLNFGSQNEIKNNHEAIKERKKMFFEGLQLD